MNGFPKKYNHKNIRKVPKNKKNGNKIYSRCISLDQNIHPGILFSIFFQDYYSKVQSWFGFYNNLMLGFSPSSRYYSSLNNDDISSKKLYLNARKQFKKNIKFLEKTGIFVHDKAIQTLSIDFNIFVRDFFGNFYSEQKVFSQKEILFWDKGQQINVPYNRLQIKKGKGIGFVIKYFIEGKGANLSLETDSLETIFSDVAVAVNPQDKRYKKLIGQNVLVPIINKSIPIIGDDSVDPFVGFGVARITPGHDQYGLEMAQKYNLTTDIFSVDIYGNFTEHAGEFAGKPVSDFYDNIVKYIDDIGNLDTKKDIQKDFFYDFKSGAQLYKLALNQWSIKHDYVIDYLIEKITTNQIVVQSEEVKNSLLSSLENLSCTTISCKSAKGLLIPILRSSDNQIYVINEGILLEHYKQSKSKKNFTLSAIILNLILNNQLNSKFTIEELVDVFFGLDFVSNQTVLSSYIELYENYGEPAFKNGIKCLKKIFDNIESDIEKIKILGEILQDNFAFRQEGDYYCFDFSTVFDTKQSFVLQYDDSFNKDFLDLLYIIFYNKLPCNLNGSFMDVDILGNTFIGLHTEKEFPLNLIILFLEYFKCIPFSNLFFHPRLVLEDGNDINNYNSQFLVKELYDIKNIYGPDVLRLNILLSEKKENTLLFDTFRVNELKRDLDKIWNAYRYVYQNIPTKNVNIINIQDILSDITEYDSWILHGFKSLLGEIKYQIQGNNYLVVGKKILNFIVNDLCDKYLESIKFFTNHNTNNIILFVFFNSLRLLEALVPVFAQELFQMFGIEYANFNILSLSDINLSEKNYKINIFMEIVDKTRILKDKLGLKKHEAVDVFVQANQDFICFLSHNQNLFQRMTNALNLMYIKLHEDLPLDYYTDTIININIGVKKTDQLPEISKDSISALLDELEDKKEYLYHMKSLMASISLNLSPETLKKKKDEIQFLQDEISLLELTVSKLKLKGNN